MHKKLPLLDDAIVCTILAGGQSRRMQGQNKACLRIDKMSLIEIVLQRVHTFFNGKIIINANDEHDFLGQFGYPLVSDLQEGYNGPLAGILASMQWAKYNAPNASYILSIACDTPFFPTNLLEKFMQAIETNDENTILVASHNNTIHPTFSLHHVNLYESLHNMLYTCHIRKIMHWVKSQNYSYVDFSDNANTQIDPFFNINTPQDYTQIIDLQIMHNENI